ncbi:MAG: S8 family serine peptidase [Phycisphaerales bacterium]
MPRSRCLVLLLSCALAATASAAPQRAPRQPLAKADLAQRPAYPHRLVVKFHDHVGARAMGDGTLTSVRGVDLAPLVDTLAAASAGDAPVRFEPVIELTEAQLQHFLADAAARSGRAQPDLGAILVVRTDEADDADVAAMARALHASDLIEYVHYEQLWPQPPGGPDACTDTLPTTPQMVQFQDYLGEDPGLGMAAAWAEPGGDGAGVRIADCEYWFRPDHEDLCNVIPEPGQQPHPDIIAFGWHEHGTAVLGEMVGGDNAYGVRGIAPGAEAWFFPEASVSEPFRRVAAVTNAIAAMDAGDVVLLEMQTFGPGGDYAPAELDPAIWLVTRAGVDRGVVVVAAAGNGTQNLDSAAYAEYRSRGDSGAIIVGAGTSTTAHAKLGFSTFGSRVNVQGWGENVFTAGYGHFAVVGGDRNQSYTDLFSGTSSASPFIAGVAASLQGIAKATTGGPIPPEDLRRLLIDTGRPQGAGGHIGPFPDVAAAVDAVLASSCRADFDGDGSLTLFDFLAFQTSFAAGELRADLDGDGEFTLFDFLAFQSAFDAGCP